MKRSYTRLNESSRRSQMLRSTMRASLREDEDEDIEIEADETAMDDSMEMGGDLATNIINLVKQAIDEGIITVDDVKEAIGSDEDAEADKENEDSEVMEEAARKARARRIAEARKRIASRNFRR